MNFIPKKVATLAFCTHKVAMKSVISGGRKIPLGKQTFLPLSIKPEILPGVPDIFSKISTTPYEANELIRGMKNCLLDLCFSIDLWLIEDCGRLDS